MQEVRRLSKRGKVCERQVERLRMYLGAYEPSPAFGAAS